MTIDPFDSAKRRLARANEHFANLKRQMAQFVGDEPYERITEKQPNGFLAMKVRLKRPLPDEWTHLATETLEALRSALDQTGFAVAGLVGVPRSKSAKFPFGDTPAEVEADIRRGCKDLPQAIHAVFRSFKPYKGGNDLLWAMNKLRNETHTTLVPIANAVGGVHVKSMSVSGPIEVLAPKWDSRKNEMTIFSGMLPGTQIEYDLEIAIHAAFGDIGLGIGTITIDALGLMSSIVAKVITDTEAECKGLGLL